MNGHHVSLYMRKFPKKFHIVNTGLKGIPMDKEKFSTGAERNSIPNVRYDLIYWPFIDELAEVMAEGALSHGDRNWEQGMSQDSVINHMMNHYRLWREGDRTEPHLAKMAFGLMALHYYEEKQIYIEE